MQSTQQTSTALASNEDVLASLPTDDRLAGRTALVTGSTAGIGEAIARVLAASGAHVLVSGRHAERGDAVVQAIRDAGGTADFLALDLTASPDELRAVTQQAVELAGQVDILVNNAGVYHVIPTVDLPDDDLDAMLTTNIRAPHVLVAALAPAMAERGDGRVVNIGSWMSRVGFPAGAIYTGTKAAIEQMTRTWASEFGPRGVRVNSVAPGATATHGNADKPEALEIMAAATVAGQAVRPVDIAYAVRWLASDEGVMAHGTVIDVDGGILNARLG